ncbi:uncharacterized protein LOC117315953 [Pecten maximus]|uniref:uncharacterized protein LOC117315953 n=1 Tax=Pecten maximus TaxID=6579 RepID=UPI001458652C|nr:uncharacterized protein LOC117315953 [Pecten maximus]
MGMTFGNHEVKYLQSHFAGRFDDDVNMLPQWRRLKTLVYQRYGTTVEALDWVIVNRALKNQEVDDILSLIDLILSLPPTSVFNERAFSHMKLIKGERRARLSSEAMSDVMMVKTQTASVKEFNPDAAITRFLTKTPCGGQRRPDFCRKSKTSEAEAEQNIEDDGIGCVELEAEKEAEEVDSESDDEYDETTTFSKLKQHVVCMEMERESENQ